VDVESRPARGAAADRLSLDAGSTVLQRMGLGLRVSIVPETCARADQWPERAYAALGRDGPMREIAVAQRRTRQCRG